MFYIHTIAGAGAYAEICCARDGGPGQPNVAKCKWNETEILAKNRAKRRRWIERKARVINSRQHHYYLRLYSQLLLNSAILSTCVMGFTLEAGDGNDEWALEIAIKCKSRYLGHLLIQENPNINFYFPPPKTEYQIPLKNCLCFVRQREMREKNTSFEMKAPSVHCTWIWKRWRYNYFAVDWKITNACDVNAPKMIFGLFSVLFSTNATFHRAKSHHSAEYSALFIWIKLPTLWHHLAFQLK